jgi:CheY-like chemotaxis protein
MLVRGDSKRLVQVVSNILNNAAKYTREGGHIVLRTEVIDTHVIIEVSDDGIGMTPDLVERVFDLFAQAERTSDRAAGGLGLGLALVKSLVGLHGGTVACSSEGLGKGSMFRVSLPRLHQPYRPYADQGIGRRLQSPKRSLRVLVVDDNVDAAAMLAMLLEAQGHEVLVEHGSLRALERAKADKPQVCLLDIGLPEIDGYELARRLRSLTDLNSAVLIAVTGYGQHSDRESALAAGFDHHLVKPVDTEKLASLFATIDSD